MPPLPPGDLDARSARRRRGATAVWVITVVVAVGFIGVFCAGFWVYANHDRPELIDSPEVSEVAESACATMRAAVAAEAAPPGAAIDARVRSISAQNAAVAAMVAQVRGLGADRLDDDHTAAWLSDWEALVEAREQYAHDLSAGRRPRFVEPIADGLPIINRMDQVDLACEVPPQLVDLQ